MRRSRLPVPPASTGRSRWRARLATLVVALFATTGLGLAAAVPAGAEEEIPFAPPSFEFLGAECEVHGGPGVASWALHDLVPIFHYSVAVFDAAEVLVHTVTYVGETSVEDGTTLPIGDYTLIASAENEVSGHRLAEVSFTIGGCPDLGVTVTPLSCSTERDGITFVTFTGLIPGELYRFDVAGPDFSVGGPFEAESDTAEREFVGMPPGNYYVYVEWSPSDEEVAPPPMFDWIAFSVDPCQPAIEVAVTQCTAVGGTGGADVTLSRLVAGVEYAVWVTDAGSPDGEAYGEPQLVTGDADAAVALQFSSLPAGREYTVWVDGVWEAEPYEEPPFIGGGNFIPLETVELTASADFSLQACPSAPVKPAAATTKLPPTGPDGIGGLLAGAILLLALGGTLAFGSRRAQRG